MNPLRSKLIRLAHANPDIRPTILPLITKRAGLDDFIRSAEDEGWEVLEGDALSKAMQVTGAKVNLAKKFGRKTVFARYHGMVTLYVVADNGYVSQDEFTKIPPLSIIVEFIQQSARRALRQASNPLVKDAATNPAVVKSIEQAWILGGKKGRRFWVQKTLENILSNLDTLTLNSTSLDVGQFCTNFGEEEFAYTLMGVMDRHGKEGLRLNQNKTASFSLVKETVGIKTVGGKVIEVSAMVHGPWSIYKNFKGGGYAVTFTPTGQAVSQRNPTLMDAKAFLEALLERAPDLARANDIGDVMRHKDIIVELIKNPPAVSGTAKKPPVAKVSEKREKLIADIRAAGLASIGERSGKAGEFFAARGLKSAPTRAISVGSRDVLLNEFDMYDEKWKLFKAELISATTPELLAKWVAWVNAGPARGDLRSSR